MAKGSTMQEAPAPMRTSANCRFRRVHAASSSVSGRVPLRAFPSHHNVLNGSTADQLLKESAEARHFLTGGSPDDVLVDSHVVVHGLVAHPDDRGPGNLGMLRLE